MGIGIGVCRSANSNSPTTLYLQNTHNILSYLVSEALDKHAAQACTILQAFGTGLAFP